jgi:hypothetical protein
VNENNILREMASALNLKLKQHSERISWHFIIFYVFSESELQDWDFSA